MFRTILLTLLLAIAGEGAFASESDESTKRGVFCRQFGGVTSVVNNIINRGPMSLFKAVEIANSKFEALTNEKELCVIGHFGVTEVLDMGDEIVGEYKIGYFQVTATAFIEIGDAYAMRHELNTPMTLYGMKLIE